MSGSRFKAGTKVRIVVDYYEILGFPKGTVCTVLPDYKQFMDKEDYTDNGLVPVSLKLEGEERKEYVYRTEITEVSDEHLRTR